MFTYNGYTLNGYLNSPNYDTEIALFKDILDQLPARGTTSVTTQHHHARISSPTADVSALTVGESGIMSAPLLSAGVLQVNADKTIGATGIALLNITSPGTGRIPYAGSTGFGSAATLTFDGTRLFTPEIVAMNIRFTTGAYLYLNGSSEPAITSITNGTTVVLGADVYTTQYASITPAILGVSGIFAGANGINCYWKKLGKEVDFWYMVAGATGVGGSVSIGLPVSADSTQQYFSAYVKVTYGGSCGVWGQVYTSGCAVIDAGCTGLNLYQSDNNSVGWTGTGARTIQGHIRYYAAA